MAFALVWVGLFFEGDAHLTFFAVEVELEVVLVVAKVEIALIFGGDGGVVFVEEALSEFVA